MVAAGVIVVVIILIALLVHGCESSATENSLKNYNADVNRLIARSDTNGSHMFADLKSGHLSTTTGRQTLQNDLDGALNNARNHLHTAESFSAPSQMSSAQSALVQVMSLREQGISKIADNIQPAANKDTSKDAVYNMSVGTSLLYGSDIIYKSFVAPDIARALHKAGIPVGSGAGGQQINAGQIVDNLGWLQSSFIATTIGAQENTSEANANNAAPGLHGHALNYVTVNGTQLSPTGTNTISAGTAPTFVLNLTNGGNFNEYQVECKVTVTGLSDIGTATIPETTPGETTTCSVRLPSAPTPGTYQVTASIVKVPGETNTSNNSATYTVTFN